MTDASHVDQLEAMLDRFVHGTDRSATRVREIESHIARYFEGLDGYEGSVFERVMDGCVLYDPDHSRDESQEVKTLTLFRGALVELMQSRM